MNQEKNVKKTKKQKEILIPVYTKQQKEADEKVFESNLKENKVDWSNFSRLMINDLCVNTEVLNDNSIGGIRLRDIRAALEYPETYWRVLLTVSNILMRRSPHYYRLNSVYSNMARFCWWIDLYGVDSDIDMDNLQKVYNRVAKRFEDMHVAHEFSKVMKIIPYKDAYCGLVVEEWSGTNSTFYLKEVPHQVYRIHQVQDGLFNFEINLNAVKAQKLGAYPDYVQQAWIDYKEGNAHFNGWYTPPAEKQICIKMNTQWEYPFPLLIELIKDLLDLDVFKKLKLQSARTDNYKAILVKVPIDEKTVDKPLLTPETLGVFADINRENMSDDIALIYNLGDSGEAISFKDSANTRNNVSDAVDEIYNAAGETQEFFNGSASGTAVMISVENTSGFVYGLYRQFERWCDRYIKIHKFNKPKFKFKFTLLDVTVFNNDNVTKKYKDAASFGVAIERWLASLGMTPSVLQGSFIMSKNIFKFAENFTPLSSSYNQSQSQNETGRPTNAENGEMLSEEGEKTADNEKNDR